MRTKKGFKLREVCGEKILLAEGVENECQFGISLGTGRRKRLHGRGDGPTAHGTI